MCDRDTCTSKTNTSSLFAMAVGALQQWSQVAIKMRGTNETPSGCTVATWAATAVQPSLLPAQFSGVLALITTCVQRGTKSH
jgi:hypothetical protein